MFCEDEEGRRVEAFINGASGVVKENMGPDKDLLSKVLL